MTATRNCSVLILVAVAATAAPSPPDKAGGAPPPTKPDRPATVAKSGGTAAEAVYRRANVPAIVDQTATLQEALDQLSKLYGVPIVTNEVAFKFEMLDDVLRKEIGYGSGIPAMDNARLDQALRPLLTRLVINSGATFIVRRDFIEITSGAALEAEVWGRSKGPQLPLVHTKYEKAPLDQVFAELADLTDFNIVLDARAAEKGKTPVTVRFLNTPLDTAVRLLADMADLRSVQHDNVLFVTSKENAAIWEERIRKENAPDDYSADPVNPDALRRGAGLGVGARKLLISNNQ